MSDERLLIALHVRRSSFITRRSSFVAAKKPGNCLPRARHHPLFLLVRRSGVALVASFFQDPVGFLDSHP
jgi:hypothetical protein